MKNVLLCNYTHMKCDPSVSCVCVDGAGDRDDSGEEGKLFTAGQKQKKKKKENTSYRSHNKEKLENHHFKP